MPFFLIVAVALAAISAIFAIQNAGVITVSFLGWEWEASLAIILILSLGVGMVIGYLAGLPSMLRKASQLRQTKRELDGRGSAVLEPDDEPWADEFERE